MGKARCQRCRQEEGEEDLNARLHHPDLLQQLDEIAIAPFELCFIALGTVAPDDRFGKDPHA
jgi:hypothetical protein